VIRPTISILGAAGALLFAWMTWPSSGAGPRASCPAAASRSAAAQREPAATREGPATDAGLGALTAAAPADEAALIEALDRFARDAASVRDGADRMKTFLSEPGNELLVDRLIRLVATGALPRGPARELVELAVLGLSDDRFAAAKAVLWKALSREESAAGAASATALRETGGSGSSEELVRTLEQIGESELRDRDIVTLVESIVGGGDRPADVRRAALDALARLRTSDESVRGDVERFLRDLLSKPLDGELEAAAVRVLATTRGDVAAETLAAVLADRSRTPAARRFAAAGLRNQSTTPDVTRELIDAYRTEGDSEIRNASLFSLGAHAAGSPDALDALLLAVRSDTDVDARRYAALALGAIPDARAESALDAAAAGDPAAGVREIAAIALRALRARASK
jgi:HEAT repeat protein